MDRCVQTAAAEQEWRFLLRLSGDCDDIAPERTSMLFSRQFEADVV